MAEPPKLQQDQINNYGYAQANLLINPGFEIWQRGTGPFTVLGDIAADEWQFSGSGGSGSVSRSSSANVGSYCADIAWTKTSADVSLQQGIENYKQLEGLWLTFSAWVLCSSASAARLFIADYVSSQDTGLSSYHTGGGAWEHLTAVKKINTSLSTPPVSWSHSFPLKVGINLEATQTGTLIDGASLVIGNFPQGVPFIPLNPADDMQRCQRFYETDGSLPRLAVAGYATTFFRHRRVFGFRTTKQSTPTVTYSTFSETNVSSSSIINDNVNGFERDYIPTADGMVYQQGSWTAEVT